MEVIFLCGFDGGVPHSRGDRMGLATFNGALNNLELNKEIVITTEDRKGRPVERIRLLRS